GPDLHCADGPVADGFLRPLLPVRFDAGRNPPRNSQLALAGLHVRLHDRARLPRRVADLSGWQLVCLRDESAHSGICYGLATRAGWLDCGDGTGLLGPADVAKLARVKGRLW